MLQALNDMKTGKAPGHSEVSLELIAASGGVALQVMSEMYKKILDGFGMAAEWALVIVAPIFKGKGDIRNCSCNRAVKFLEYGMKVLERVSEKRLRRLVSVDEMQFGSMPERGTIDAVLILRRLQNEYHAKEKSYMCFVDQ